MSNPLVAERKDSTQGFSGVPLLESVNDTSKAIESGDWAAGVLGAAGTALDALGMALDPFGAIFSAGVGWLIEHVGPLSDALDELTGDPDQIKAHAQTWTNIAGELGSISTEMANLIASDTASWTGESADAYRARSTDTANLIGAAKAAAEGAASGIGTAGEVVAAVRTLVRDIIAELVGHLISWALQVLFTLGIGMVWVVPQVIGAVAKTATKIAGLTTKLVQALGKLAPMLKKLGGAFGDVSKSLKNVKPGKAPSPRPAPSPGTRSMSDSRGGRGDQVHNDSSPGSNMPGLNSNTTPSSAAPTPTPSGSTPNPAPTPSAPTPSAPTPTPGPNSPSIGTGPMQGTAPNGQKYNFSPNQVQSVPLKDSNGNTIGISYPTKSDDVTNVTDWAGKPNRHSDGSYLPDYASGGKASKKPSKQAPWNGNDPFYVHAHANPNKFSVNVNTAAPGQPPNWQKVRVDGNTHGQLVNSNQHFQAASQANPQRPVVYMSCNSGNPTGNAASSSASTVHSGGHAGDVFAPTGTGSRVTNGNNSWYGVKPGTDGSGGTIPGEFVKF
ncbi:uncharacterized protein YukE [Kibdelosporangium banguiense]|uniref:Uncharacterized protein YukE n=1 Tax=Kibdelosporangium banguiense TaxID=1365924 RepID=A0ABS4TKT4_9PSEU|nr:uncharacterized protein YukE [Kibdelosporangium banguiense]